IGIKPSAIANGHTVVIRHNSTICNLKTKRAGVIYLIMVTYVTSKADALKLQGKHFALHQA
ncbi:hypothetical protein, partial [Pseudomonas sp. Sample_24]|uniref:hypothetical protein n=1 Tax=Pseudomonas sp. Sample_24 TaxID=2448268 RepID=UPI0019D5207A